MGKLLTEWIKPPAPRRDALPSQRRPPHKGKDLVLPPTPGIVFSVPGGENPASHLRLLLLRAGDVEQNPGPASAKLLCQQCNKKLRSDQRHFSCTTPGCPATSHIQEACSGLPKQSRPQRWVCQLHSGRTPPNTSVGSSSPAEGTAGSHCAEQVVNETPNSPATSSSESDDRNSTPTNMKKEKCSTCRKQLQGRATPLTCVYPLCTKQTHKQTKCSSLSKKELKIGVWRCPNHRTRQTPPTPTSPTSSPTTSSPTTSPSTTSPPATPAPPTHPPSPLPTYQPGHKLLKSQSPRGSLALSGRSA